MSSGEANTRGGLESLPPAEVQEMKEESIRKQASEGKQPGTQIMQARAQYEQWGNVPGEVYDEGAAQGIRGNERSITEHKN